MFHGKATQHTLPQPPQTATHLAGRLKHAAQVLRLPQGVLILQLCQLSIAPV